MTVLRALLIAGIVASAAGIAGQGHADVVVFLENFNDDIDTLADPTDAEFTKADNDSSVTFFSTTGATLAERGYWGIYDPDGATNGDTNDFDTGSTPNSGSQTGQVPAFSGFTGNYLIGENLDRTAVNTLPLSLTWSNLDISGLTNITFSGVFAAQTGEWDNLDSIKIQYRFNGSGSFLDLANFTGGTGNNLIASGFNESGSLGLTAQTFTAAIAGTGSTLDLRILMSSNEGGEDFAFDSIQIASVPEPAAILFGVLICGVLGVKAGGRSLLGRLVRRDAC